MRLVGFLVSVGSTYVILYLSSDPKGNLKEFFGSTRIIRYHTLRTATKQPVPAQDSNLHPLRAEYIIPNHWAIATPPTCSASEANVQM